MQDHTGLIRPRPMGARGVVAVRPHTQAQRTPTTAELLESSAKADVFSVDEVGERTVL